MTLYAGFKRCFIALGILTLSSLFQPFSPLHAEPIQILKISPHDEIAVIKTGDGKMRVVKAGDVIGQSTIVEITEGRIVMEGKKGKDAEKVIIRFANGKQTVERMKKTGDAHDMVYSSGHVSDKEK